MIALLMTVSLISSVLLIAVCAPLAPAAPPVLDSPDRDAAPYIREEPGFDFPIDRKNLFTDTEGDEMRSDLIKDQMRLRIVEKSIEILREHGKSDDEILSMLLRDFRINEELLDGLLGKSAP